MTNMETAPTDQSFEKKPGSPPRSGARYVIPTILLAYAYLALAAQWTPIAAYFAGGFGQLLFWFAGAAWILALLAAEPAPASKPERLLRLTIIALVNGPLFVAIYVAATIFSTPPDVGIILLIFPLLAAPILPFTVWATIRTFRAPDSVNKPKRSPLRDSA